MYSCIPSHAKTVWGGTIATDVEGHSPVWFSEIKSGGTIHWTIAMTICNREVHRQCCSHTNIQNIHPIQYSRMYIIEDAELRSF